MININHKMSDFVCGDASPQHLLCQHQPHWHASPVMNGSHIHYTEFCLLTRWKAHCVGQAKIPAVWPWFDTRGGGGHGGGGQLCHRSWKKVTDGAESSSRQCHNLERKIRCSDHSDQQLYNTVHLYECMDHLATDLHFLFKICNITEHINVSPRDLGQ